VADFAPSICELVDILGRRALLASPFDPVGRRSVDADLALVAAGGGGGDHAIGQADGGVA
jgi:hypothetical protein